jgi:hypothetical protein
LSQKFRTGATKTRDRNTRTGEIPTDLRRDIAGLQRFPTPLWKALQRAQVYASAQKVPAGRNAPPLSLSDRLTLAA